MLSFSSVKRVYVARDAQDMRRGIDTLACVVEHELGHEPYAGDCFVFFSRDRSKLKVLIWEDGGFWLCLKRLFAGTFAAAFTWCAADAGHRSVQTPRYPWLALSSAQRSVALLREDRLPAP
jgi:transposase